MSQLKQITVERREGFLNCITKGDDAILRILKKKFGYYEEKTIYMQFIEHQLCQLNVIDLQAGPSVSVLSMTRAGFQRW